MSTGPTAGCALVWCDSDAKGEEGESERVGAVRQRASVADPPGVGEALGGSMLPGVSGKRLLIPSPIAIAGERPVQDLKADVFYCCAQTVEAHVQGGSS